MTAPGVLPSSGNRPQRGVYRHFKGEDYTVVGLGVSAFRERAKPTGRREPFIARHHERPDLFVLCEWSSSSRLRRTTGAIILMFGLNVLFVDKRLLVVYQAPNDKMYFREIDGPDGFTSPVLVDNEVKQRYAWRHCTTMSL